MIKLNKITITNIRRFGNEICIPVSSGATIFLAPNGTGKTALFEAIEMCLTGNVARLSGNINAIIQDNKDTAVVELDFSNDINCKVIARKNRPISISGQQRAIYGTTSAENVPYLLRLTHMLSQHSTNWFVQSQPGEAGALLEKLTLGRDASIVSGKMTALKRATSTILSEAENQLAQINQTSDTWNNLLQQKKEYDDDLQSDLKPFEDIVAQIISFQNELLLTELSGPPPAALLRTNAAEISEALHQNLQKNKRFETELISLGPLVSLFLKATNDSKILEKEIATLEDRKKKMETQIANNKGDFERTQKEKQNKDQILQSFLKSRQLRLELSQLEADSHRIANLIETTSAELSTAQNIQLDNIAKEGLELKLREDHRKLEISARTTSQSVVEIDNRDASITAWRNALMALEKENSKFENLSKFLSDSRNRLSSFENELAIKSRALETAEKNYTQLARTTNLINAAVSSIIANLPINATNCPVCLTEFQSDTLKQRMNLALQSIHPGLEEASQNVKSLRNEKDESSNTINSLTFEIEMTQMELSTIVANIDDYRKSISIYNSQLGQVYSLEQTVEHNRVIRKQLTDEISRILSEKNKLEVPRSDYDFAILRDQIRINADQIKGFNNRIEELNRQMGIISDKIQQLELGLNQISTEIFLENENEVIASNQLVDNKLLSLQNNLDILRNDLADTQREIDSNHLRLSLLQSEINSINARWQQNNLQNAPSNHDLLDAQNQLKYVQNNIEEKQSIIDNLQIEIAKWIVIEENKQINSKIDALKGNRSIDEYSIYLSNEKASKQERVDLIATRAIALNEFSNHLRDQMQVLQTHFEGVNQPWQRLLNRVVLDKRFSKTEMTSYSYYNKQQAEVNIELHKHPMTAKDVASEAQMTDLQLTFILAMALRYQWSPWKALLLDDPTQHHDLVHASSVFDVLRDYIADHNFQLLLATHDATQANFLMRKLNNDGIPASLVILKPGIEGVTAAPAF